MRLIPFLAALALAGACSAESASGGGDAEAARAAAEADAAPLRELTGHLVDLADLLPPEAERGLAAELAALEAETGDQLVVVTLDGLRGETIESVAMRLGNGWGIGDEELDNGVLLIVAPSDRLTRIEVGCGLEGLLTDERAGEIVDGTLLPNFREGRFQQGIAAGVAAIGSVLRSDRLRPQRRPRIGPGPDPCLPRAA